MPSKLGLFRDFRLSSSEPVSAKSGELRAAIDALLSSTMQIRLDLLQPIIAEYARVK
jgi:hypothetical protein